jgi:integrase
MSVHQTKDGRWYTKYWENSRYHKKYFGRGKSAKIKAEDFDLKIKRLKKRGIKITETEPKFQPLHLDELAQLYLNDRRNSGWSEKQEYDFKAFMNRYVIPSIGDKLCTDITMADLVRLRDYIAKNSTKAKLSPHSINRYLTSTKAVFGWGVENDLIPFNPWAKFKKPKEKPDKPSLLSLEEFLSVMKNAAPHCRWALDVEFNTGCRPGSTELFKLKFSDVNWEEAELLIRATKTAPRIVTLKPDFLERLGGAFENSDCEYIISYKGKPVKKLRRSFSTALRKAGINKKVRLYDIRHMYGTFMAKNKADIFAIQQLMGHSDISTTRRYLHHAEEMKLDAVNNCLPSLDL